MCFFLFHIVIILPDKEGIPVLMHNNVGSVGKDSSLLCLHQVMLSQGYSVLSACAVHRKGPVK